MQGIGEGGWSVSFASLRDADAIRTGFSKVLNKTRQRQGCKRHRTRGEAAILLSLLG